MRSPVQYHFQLSFHFQRPYARLFQLRFQFILAFPGDLLQFFLSGIFSLNELFLLHRKRHSLRHDTQVRDGYKPA